MSKEEFEVEFEGIYNTIKSYTNDYFILGYINGLQKALVEEDELKIHIILPKLLGWYKNSMSTIQGSNFVFNKVQHKQARKILKEYHDSIISKRV